MADVTLNDIAREMHVSAVTVSNALYGKKGVSAETAEAVREKAVELGFDLSKYEKKKRSGCTIGIYASEAYISVGDSFYWELYQKTMYQAARRHCYTMLEIAPMGEENPPFPQMVTEGKIDGLIIIGKMKREFLESVLAAARIPVVLLDYGIPELPADMVLSNNYVGAMRATQYLIDLGHREIGFIGTPTTSENVMSRFLGYRRSLMANHLPYRSEFYVEERDRRTEDVDGIPLPEKLPTAFFASSDYAALFVLEALEARGIRVPADVSMTSYDNYLARRPHSNPFTSYNVDMEQMAKTAVKIILRKIAGDDRKPSFHFVDSELVIRGSARALQK